MHHFSTTIHTTLYPLFPGYPFSKLDVSQVKACSGVKLDFLFLWDWNRHMLEISGQNTTPWYQSEMSLWNEFGSGSGKNIYSLTKWSFGIKYQGSKERWWSALWSTALLASGLVARNVCGNWYPNICSGTQKMWFRWKLGLWRMSFFSFFSTPLGFF